MSSCGDDLLPCGLGLKHVARFAIWFMIAHKLKPALTRWLASGNDERPQWIVSLNSEISISHIVNSTDSTKIGEESRWRHWHRLRSGTSF